MKQKRIEVDHPLWQRLRKLDRTAANRFPADYDRGFGSLGLILSSRLKHGGYWCTPTNTLSFAHTGGDGVHFSFLVMDGKITEQSPIVITIPEAYDQPNFIGGESLFDFLCLGYHRGYFALQTLPSKRCFAAYASGKWRPKNDQDHYVGYGVSEHQRLLLDFLIEQLGLSPWKDMRRRFARLQKKYMRLLDVPAPPWGSI